ncbi:CotY/CotZ family spore coat protein [Caldifermentibacillus hisashii]|uniref:CotY/CotZ family spore coat protein n=1 Tax=Caldifermentibacillus hisashii TaxID=996558 RepID=UPI003368F2A1
MACGNDHSSEQCVCNLLRDIAELQHQHQSGCQFGCETSLRELRHPGMNFDCNAIPFMLICKGTCDFFVGTGVFRDTTTTPPTFECLETPVFRVVKVDENCCAKLELLQPRDAAGGPVPIDDTVEGICRFFPPREVVRFTGTGICITVSLDCFCGVELLGAVNVVEESPVPPPPPGRECPCEVHLVTLGTSPATLTVTGIGAGTYEGTIQNINLNQCGGNCNPNVDILTLSFLDNTAPATGTFNLNGRRLRFTCTPNPNGTVTFVGTADSSGSIVNGDDFIVTINVAVTGNTATWTISGSNGTTNFSFAPFTAPLSVNVIENCPS